MSCQTVYDCNIDQLIDSIFYSVKKNIICFLHNLSLFEFLIFNLFLVSFKTGPNIVIFSILI